MIEDALPLVVAPDNRTKPFADGLARDLTDLEALRLPVDCGDRVIADRDGVAIVPRQRIAEVALSKRVRDGLKDLAATHDFKA